MPTHSRTTRFKELREREAKVLDAKQRKKERKKVQRLRKKEAKRQATTSTEKEAESGVVKEVVQALVETVHMREKLRMRRQLSTASQPEAGTRERPSRTSARARPHGRYKEPSLEDSSSSSSDGMKSERDEPFRSSDETDVDSAASSRASSADAVTSTPTVSSSSSSPRRRMKEVRVTLEEIIDAVVRSADGSQSSLNKSSDQRLVVQVKIFRDETSRLILDHQRLAQLLEGAQIESSSPAKRSSKRSRSPSLEVAKRPARSRQHGSPSFTKSNFIEGEKNGIRTPSKLRSRSPSVENGRILKDRLQVLARSTRSPNHRQAVVGNGHMSPVKRSRSPTSEAKHLSEAKLEVVVNFSEESPLKRVKKRLLTCSDPVAVFSSSQVMLDTTSSKLDVEPALEKEKELVIEGGASRDVVPEVLRVRQDDPASNIINIEDISVVERLGMSANRVVVNKEEIGRLEPTRVGRKKNKRQVEKKLAKKLKGKGLQISLAQKALAVEKMEKGCSQVCTIYHSWAHFR